jgi:pyruvate,water dikinase
VWQKLLLHFIQIKNCAFSDFKSNEYYNLLGGKYYEPNEENPMIGWRGASRYYSDAYKEAFGLECRAIKKSTE